LAWNLSQLDTDWYINFDSNVSNIPDGKSKLIFVPVKLGLSVMTTTELQAIADARPGAIWYVGGEPNVLFSVDNVIEDMRYYYTEIKKVDPTARITSPSILNWEFTCNGCGGYQSGQSWMTNFVDRYQDLYGILPPWDIWAIDLYPLDWVNLPNTGFPPELIAQYSPQLPPNSQSIPAKQVQGYRNYIDSLPGKSGQPIIITEIGMHWGWTEIQFGIPGCDSGRPAGQYKPLVVRDYFDSVFSWLENNALSYNIERWFTYVTYSDIANCRFDGYSGMSLFDASGVGSKLTDIGRWYAARSAP
jgi:hypothetical protein